MQLMEKQMGKFNELMAKARAILLEADPSASMDAGATPQPEPGGGVPPMEGGDQMAGGAPAPEAASTEQVSHKIANDVLTTMIATLIECIFADKEGKTSAIAKITMGVKNKDIEVKTSKRSDLIEIYKNIRHVLLDQNTIQRLENSIKKNQLEIKKLMKENPEITLVKPTDLILRRIVLLMCSIARIPSGSTLGELSNPAILDADAVTPANAMDVLDTLEEKYKSIDSLAKV